MSSKITRKYNLSASGILSVDGDRQIYIETENNGIVNLADLLYDFDAKNVKLSVNYDEDYDVEVDEETGEVL
jgi:hypothetical protein